MTTPCLLIAALGLLSLAACDPPNGPPVPTTVPSVASGYTLDDGPKARPEFVGPGAAGVCAIAPGAFAEFVLEIDTPNPRCSEVRGHQGMRIVNHFPRRVTARLGGLQVFLAPGGAVTVTEPFSAYLEPGGHSIRITDAYGIEIILR